MDDLDEAMKKINSGLGWDMFHTSSLKLAAAVIRKSLHKIYNKMMSHCFVSCTKLNGEIHPVIKTGKSCKFDSRFRPVMNSSVFLKILEHLILPVLKIIWVWVYVNLGFDLLRKVSTLLWYFKKWWIVILNINLKSIVIR